MRSNNKYQKGGVCTECGEPTCPLHADANAAKSQKKETYHVDITVINNETGEWTMGMFLTDEMRKKIIEWYYKMLSTEYFAKRIRDVVIRDSDKYEGEFEISYVPIKYISHFEVTEPVDKINIKYKGETYRVLPNYDPL